MEQMVARELQVQMDQMEAQEHQVLMVLQERPAQMVALVLQVQMDQTVLVERQAQMVLLEHQLLFLEQLIHLLNLPLLQPLVIQQ